MNKEMPEDFRFTSEQIQVHYLKGSKRHTPEYLAKNSQTYILIQSSVIESVRAAEDNAWVAFKEWILTTDGLQLSSFLAYEAGKQDTMMKVIDVINEQVEYQTMSGEKEGPDSEIMIDKSTLLSAIAAKNDL